MNNKKQSKIKTITEIIIRLLFFVTMPAAFSSGFLGIKLLLTAIGKGEPLNIGSLWILIGLSVFTIVFGNSGKSVQKFAVMDLMGAVVQKGETHLRETSVSLQNTGTYIIRVGNESRVVNVKVAEGN